MPNNGRIDHLRIVEHLATGGSADIYKVFNEKLDVVRAVKMFRAECNQEVRMRLKTEAKISANLRHPNVVEIYSVGEYEGMPYIEMEYVDGGSVERLITEMPGGLPIEQSLSIVYSISQALYLMATKTVMIDGQEYRGLIHRDIKPSNILITKDGVPKLADFGVARPQEVSLHTVHAGGYIGTLAYLAPEQFSDNALDGRVDIYALGAVLYEMLTGKKAFPQKDMNILIHSKMTGQYVPIPIQMQNRRHRAAADITHKCLSVDRDKRYATAHELGEAIIKVNDNNKCKTIIKTKNVRRGSRHIGIIIVIGIVGVFFWMIAGIRRDNISTEEDFRPSLAGMQIETVTDEATIEYKPPQNVMETEVRKTDAVISTTVSTDDTAQRTIVVEKMVTNTDDINKKSYKGKSDSRAVREQSKFSQTVKPTDDKVGGIWLRDTLHVTAGAAVRLIVKNRFHEAAALLAGHTDVTAKYYYAHTVDKLYLRRPTSDNFDVAASAWDALLAKCAAGEDSEKYCLEGRKLYYSKYKKTEEVQ